MRYLCVALMCVCLFATGWLAGKVYGGSWELPPWLTRLGEMAAYTPGEPLLFNSGLFMLLFVAFTGIHTLCRRRRGLQMAAVIAFSLYFYWKSSATYCFILLGICLTDYGLGLTMGATRSRTMRRALVWANVLINVGMLVYFKYFNLLGQTLASITSTDFDPLDLVLPAGISFFSFRSMSYMVDLYRRRMEPCRSLLAGPVVRAADMLPQIRAGRPATRAMVSEGIFLVICGLVKKVIVADYLAGNFVDRIFDNPALYSGFENLMGVAGFTIQIYCDFSGYSDMAIGLALMLGFRFKDNFNAPFKSQSPTEFWRRWHISLSSWLRDYIYIPLGGNRRGKARQYVNLTGTTLGRRQSREKTLARTTAPQRHTPARRSQYNPHPGAHHGRNDDIQGTHAGRHSRDVAPDSHRLPPAGNPVVHRSLHAHHLHHSRRLDDALAAAPPHHRPHAPLQRAPHGCAGRHPRHRHLLHHPDPPGRPGALRLPQILTPGGG